MVGATIQNLRSSQRAVAALIGIIKVNAGQPEASGVL